MWLVDLPVDTQIAIGGVVLAILGLAIKYLTIYVPWLGDFLNKYKEEWALAVSGALITWLSNTLPGGEYEGVSILGVQLVVAIIVLVLTKLGLSRLGVRGFK